MDLVYAVVTLPAGDDTVALLLFIDDKTGDVLKKVQIPTWQQVYSIPLQKLLVHTFLQALVGTFLCIGKYNNVHRSCTPSHSEGLQADIVMRSTIYSH